MLSNFLRRLGGWLKQGWRGVRPAVLAAVILFAVAQLPAAPSERALIAGVALQLMGLTTIAAGLAQVRRLFGRPPWWERLWEWAKNLPRWKPRAANVDGESHVTGGGSVRAVPWGGAPEGASLEKRVSELESNIETVRDRLGETTEAIDKERGEREAADQDEGRRRKEADATLDRNLEELAVGGLSLEWAGALWLFLGTLLAGLSRWMGGLLRVLEL